MTLRVEWDEDKATSNLKKHGVAFQLATRVFHDPARLERFDDREDYGEDRFLTIGLVGDVELAISYTIRHNTIRIISARQAERHEQRNYWKNR
jgi:hypothetical protein